jgi:hypothetical protein
MPRKKQNVVRFSVTTPESVKLTLERLAAENGRSLAVEAGRCLEAALRERGLLVAPPVESEPSR